MKSLVLGLAAMMFSFQVFATNNIGPGNYVAKNKDGVERVSLTLAAGGKIPVLRLNTTVGKSTCTGTYALTGDNLKASVNCDSKSLHTLLGSPFSAIEIAINVAGATNAEMAKPSGARVTFDANDGAHVDDYNLFRR